MSGLGGLNKSPEGVVLGLVQLQLPVVQTPGQLQRQAERIVDMVGKARRNNAGLDLVVFPEYALHGLSMSTEPALIGVGPVDFLAHVLARPAANDEESLRYDAEVERVAMELVMAHERALGARLEGEDQPSGRASGIEFGLSQAGEADPSMLQLAQGREGVKGGAECPIELPDHEDVEAPPRGVGPELAPGGSVSQVAGGSMVDILESFPTSSCRVLAECHKLDLGVLILVAGADPRV